MSSSRARRAPIVDQPPGYKGIVDRSDVLREQLADVTRRFPVGLRVTHVHGGRTGVITLDQPPNVPGHFDGSPTAWCLRPSAGLLVPWVCANWENERGFDRWIVWVPAASVYRTTELSHINRPSNTSRS